MAAALVALAGCQHEIVTPVDSRITLDPSNTYYAGDPVRFLIGGQPDNILSFSGETGSQYRFKDRYTVPVEQVHAATLHLDFQARYGTAGALEVWVSKDFDGLKGDDGAADRATVKALVDGGMKGWTRLEYEEGASTKWTAQDYALNEYLDNFTLAFHWCPAASNATQRTYWINGSITLDMEGAEPSTMNMMDLDAIVVMMNEELDPYHKNAGNGSIRFDNPSAASICCQGVGANVLTYALDGWVFTRPSPLNRVASDKGAVIKNLQNYLGSYEYVYETPGNYTASFLCTNANYLDTSTEVQEFKFSIIEKPEE